MRFMMLMIPLGYETAPPDVQLDPERVKAMMKYNEALKQAGVLIALDGLHPLSMGARVSFTTGKPVVTDGRVGNDTMKAVKDYQTKMGLLPADGYGGLKVLARLRQGG